MSRFKIVAKEAGEAKKYAEKADRLEQVIANVMKCDFGDRYVPNTQLPVSVEVTVVVPGDQQRLERHVLRSKTVARAIHALFLVDLQEQLDSANQCMEDSIREAQSE